MVVKPGDELPNVNVWILKPGSSNPNVVPVSILELVRGLRCILFAVPGPFTPGCTRVHAPGFIEKAGAGAFSNKRIDRVFCISSADAFVMDEWSKSLGNHNGAVTMLSDGNLELATALGLVLDGRSKGLGYRWKRCAMLVNDGYVCDLEVDDGKVVHTSAQAVLSRL